MPPSLLRYLNLLMLVSAGLSAGADPIPYQPTAEDAVPAAILGQAGAPQGKGLAYFAANSNTLGYLAEPAVQTAENAGANRGAVILIHEWNGLSDRVRQVADAFAAEGYLALAVDLYSGRTGSNRSENMALVRETLADPDAIIRNLDAAASYLKSRPEGKQKVAAIGWCYGGGVALSYALGSENHDATAIFYGRLLDDPEQLKHLHHEIYGTFAGLDNGIPPRQVDDFVAALRKAGVPNEVHIYDAVKHGFWLHVDRDPDTNLAPALHAWQRLKNYLRRALSG